MINEKKLAKAIDLNKKCLDKRIKKQLELGYNGYVRSDNLRKHKYEFGLPVEDQVRELQSHLINSYARMGYACCMQQFLPGVEQSDNYILVFVKCQ